MKKAKWIWLSTEQKPDEYVEFDVSFTGDKSKGAYFAVSAKGDYALYREDRLVAFGQYADYPQNKIFDSVDIGKFVRDGENKFRLVCWHPGIDTFGYIEDGAGVIFEITDCDGNVLCYSHEGMECSLSRNYLSYKCKLITTQLGYSYTYDMQGGDGNFVPAVSVPGAVELSPRPVKKLVLKSPVFGKRISETKMLYDIGKEMCGFLCVTLSAPCGEIITVSYGEHIEDGGVRRKIGERDFSVEIIGSGKIDKAVCAFRRLGCRYLEVDGNADIIDIGICETEYPVEEKKTRIENPERRTVYETAVHTLKLCMHEHYEDCPWREQAMYVLDTYIQMRCGYYAMESTGFAEAAIRLMAQGQRENGLFELCFPCRVNLTIPSFTLVFPMLVYDYVAYTRNVSKVDELYDVMEKAVGYFIDRIDDSGLFKTVSSEGIWHFYEWTDGLDGAFFSTDPAARIFDEYDSVINAYVSIACDRLARLCRLCGKFGRANELDVIRGNINNKIYDTFFVPETGLFRTRAGDTVYRALPNSLCLLAGVCSESEASVIADRLSVGDGLEPNTLSMNIFRYDALIAVNRSKYADGILSELDGLYGDMVKCGATSFWETGKGAADFDGAGSLCHGWSAIPAYYYHILGVAGHEAPLLTEAFETKDKRTRTDYNRSIVDYINRKSHAFLSERDKYLYMPEEKKRRAFMRMLGSPICDRKASKARLVETETVYRTDKFTATQYVFDINGIKFGGIMFEAGETSADDALIFAIHGGGGTPEMIGGLNSDTFNYNDMVGRIVRKGVRVFAPQLLLWNPEMYGSPYDREVINRRLIQMGGSITALELGMMSSVLDYGFGLNDTGKRGVIGLSYGGMYALHLGACDTRFKAVYSSCWFSDRSKHCWHDWTYFNAQKKFFDAETASLVLPRNLFIELGENDPTFRASDAKGELKRLSEYAEKMRLTDKLTVKVFDGGHELDKNDDMIDKFIACIL